jgi:hypothetical protein
MNTNQHPRWILFITLLLGILALGWSVWMLTRQSGPAVPAQAAPLPSASPLPTEMLTPPTNKLLQNAKTECSLVKDNSLKATECANMLAILDPPQKIKNNGLQPVSIPTLSNIGWPTPIPIYLLQRSAGNGQIFEESLYTNTPEVAFNNWIEKTADSYLMAIAVHDTANSVYEISIEEHSMEGDYSILPNRGGDYPLPIQGQAFTIVDAVGGTLLLHTAGGSTFAFDTAARQYVSPDPYLPFQRAVGGGTLVEDGAVPFTRPGYTGWSRWSTRQPDGQTLTVYSGVDNGNGMELSIGKPVLAVVTSRGQPGPSDAVQFYQPIFGG